VVSKQCFAALGINFKRNRSCLGLEQLVDFLEELKAFDATHGTLTEDDLAHYQKIVVALSETIRLMKEIDEKFVVMFISHHYAEKVWTNHERQAAQSRALTERGEFILPVRFDDTPIEGLLPTVGYLDSITDSTRGAAKDELRFKYWIRPDGGSDFSTIAAPSTAGGR